MSGPTGMDMAKPDYLTWEQFYRAFDVCNNYIYKHGGTDADLQMVLARHCEDVGEELAQERSLLLLRGFGAKRRRLERIVANPPPAKVAKLAETQDAHHIDWEADLADLDDESWVE